MALKHDAAGPILVISPHLDDAVVSAWSVLREEKSVCVANLCTGVPPAGFVTRYDRVAGATESAAIMKERLDEDSEALALAGRRSLAFGFLDHQYRAEPLDATAVVTALTDVVPKISSIYAPAGLGGHLDHVAAREAAIILHSVSGAPLTLYSDLPYAVRYGWPAYVLGDSPDPYLNVDAEWDHFLDPIRERWVLSITVRELSDEESDRKLVAMRTYRTQFSSLNSGIVNRLVNPRIRRYEVFWQVSDRVA